MSAQKSHLENSSAQKASAQSTRRTVSLGNAEPSSLPHTGQYVDRSHAEQHRLVTTYGARTANQINMQHAMKPTSIPKDQYMTEASCHGRVGAQPALKQYENIIIFPAKESKGLKDTHP